MKKIYLLLFWFTIIILHTGCVTTHTPSVLKLEKSNEKLFELLDDTNVILKVDNKSKNYPLLKSKLLSGITNASDSYLDALNSCFYYIPTVSYDKRDNKLNNIVRCMKKRGYHIPVEKLLGIERGIVVSTVVDDIVLTIKVNELPSYLDNMGSNKIYVVRGYSHLKIAFIENKDSNYSDVVFDFDAHSYTDTRYESLYKNSYIKTKQKVIKAYTDTLDSLNIGYKIVK